MKSFDKKIDRGILSNSPVYSILVVYMPLSALIAFIFIIDSFIPIKLSLVIFILTSGISALAASFYSDFMKDVKASRAAANIRGGIIIILITYAVSSICLAEKSWSEKFIPNITNIPASVFAVYIWVNVISLKQLFNARMQFEKITENYQNEQLKEQLFGNPALLQYTDENIKKARYKYFSQLTVICILVIICVIYKIHLPLPLFFMFLLMLSGAVCIYGLFEIIKWEQYFAGEGINLSAPDRAKRILAIIILTFLGLVSAFLLSFEKSLMPFSLISGFFSWFFSLFARPAAKSEYIIRDEDFTSMDLPPDFSGFYEAPDSTFMQLLTKYGLTIIKYGLIVLGSVLFIKFMISPLFRKNRIKDKLTFREKLFRIVIEWFKGIITAVVLFFKHLKNNNKMKIKKQNADKIKNTAEILFNTYSPAKKQDMRQSITLFARLIIWGGETRDVTWKPSHAPGEYCAILAAAPAVIANTNLAANFPAQDSDTALQRQNAGIIRCGAIFEKAIYSADVLSDEERKEFKNLVKEITSTEDIE